MIEGGIILKIKRRSEDLIIFQILDICKEGVGKTRIVYQANLNSQRVDHYLEILVKNGLIDKVPLGSRAFYKTTHKGIILGEKFDRLRSEMEELHDILLDTTA